MSELKDFVIENGVLKKYVGRGGDVVIPEGVTSIGKYAFYNCEGLTNIIIPKGVKRIGEHAFEGCSSLDSIEIPKGVTKIGFASFKECSSLTSIEIPNGVTEIDMDAFSMCDSLTAATILSKLTKVGGNIFSYCPKLESIKFAENIIDLVADKIFFGGKIIGAEVITKSGDLLKSVLVVRRIYYVQTWNYKKEYLLPLDEESAMHYDMLLATGDYEGFKLSEKQRLKAVLYRFQNNKYPINEEVKDIIVYYLKERVDEAIKLAEKTKEPAFIKTIMDLGCITEENKEGVLKKLKKSKVEEIKAVSEILI